MASSSAYASNSQYCPRQKYDVFLSFRGEDTRRNFTSHLYQGLDNRGIFTFLDDKRLEEGDSISEELVKAIEESQVAIIVFSKNYATSRWCLNELVKIMECKEKENGQTVIPVFCYVDPSHVRYQRESFAEAFSKHESRYKDDVEGMQKVKGWRNALTAAADLKGYDIRDGVESESDCIKRIVDQISSKCKTSVSYLQEFVGIDTQLKKVESLLKMEINDVRIVWIWGMGGVGKTTIAKTIFYKLLSKFKGVCFLENIKENKHKIVSLQNILLSELLGEKDNCVKDKEVGRSMLACRLRRKKVLVVLDDIDHRDQLAYLAKDLDWFGKGSRIIATTRDKRLVGENDIVYEMETLLDRDAIKLFNQYAFKEKVPNECFKNLTLEIVSHAKGHPLALKVWGSSLHQMDITEWGSALGRIKKNSDIEITENLKISYDGLEPEEQEIFLDIACFFRGSKKEEVTHVLESCYSGSKIGLRVLVNKSLVSISKNNMIEMHDLIQDMGKCIVQMQKHPGERSRLWNVKDFKEVMDNNMGTMAVEAIWFTYFEKLNFDKEAMKNMKMLRILHIFTKDESSRMAYFMKPDSNCQDGSIEYLSNNLRWFVWHDYPWKLLPENFNPRRLVHLDLRWSSLHYLWNETKQLPFLRRLHLTGSKSMKRTPDFTGMPNLEYLNLKECRNLEEVHHSLGCSRKLILLDLHYCERLQRFPYINVESLKSLNLNGCSSLEKFPEILGRMKPELEITMSFSGIRELPLSINIHFDLTKLDLKFMEKLVSLPSNICKLKGLVMLDVSFCSKLESLPEEIGDLESLEELHALQTLISRPPSSIIHLSKLKILSLSIKKLNYGVSLVFPEVNEGLRSLEHLSLSYCNIIDGGLPEDIGSLSSLKKLDLDGNNFEHLPRSIAQLGALRSLGLSDCKRLALLPEFPQQLDTIFADWSNDWICNSLFQNISLLQHDISVSDSLSLRVFTSSPENIPSWFHHQGKGASVSVNLPENWYVSDNFLGFAVGFSGILIGDITAHLIPLCDDGMSSMTRKFALSIHSEYNEEWNIHFLLVPLGGLWDASNANGKSPNDYGCIKLYSAQKINDFGEIIDFDELDDFREIDEYGEINDFGEMDEYGEIYEYGVRLLYKDESELCIGIRKSRYEEASGSSSKKQRSRLD